jgi:hypothetical protein
MRRSACRTNVARRSRADLGRMGVGCPGARTVQTPANSVGYAISRNRAGERRSRSVRDDGFDLRRHPRFRRRQELIEETRDT